MFWSHIADTDLGYSCVLSTVILHINSNTYSHNLSTSFSTLFLVGNFQSKRKTPTCITFYRNERMFGADAMALMSRKPELTFAKAFRMLGKWLRRIMCVLFFILCCVVLCCVVLCCVVFCFVIHYLFVLFCFVLFFILLCFASYCFCLVLLFLMCFIHVKESGLKWFYCKHCTVWYSMIQYKIM